MIRIVAILLVSLLAGPAAADSMRPVTDKERAAIEKALAEEGCAGGDMKFDAGEKIFEVENAKCGDGKLYEIYIDESFEIESKIAAD